MGVYSAIAAVSSLWESSSKFEELFLFDSQCFALIWEDGNLSVTRVWVCLPTFSIPSALVQRINPPTSL
jgi:hypothetical protein